MSDIENTNEVVENTASTLLAGEPTTETVTQEIAIPEKFLVDGKPDYNKLASSYLELEKKIGSKIAPTDPKEYAYEFKAADRFDTEQVEAFKQKAGELGFTRDQFAAAMSIYEDNVLALVDQYTQTPEKASAALKEAWGDNYDANLKSAFAAFNTFGQDIAIEEIGNNPTVIKLLANIGKQIGEDRGINNNATSKGTTLSKLEIQELQARPDYWTNPEVQKIVNTWYSETYK